MTEDKLLQALGRAAREQQEREGLDERWEALSAGKLSAEEEAQLRDEASESSDGQIALEAFRPLGKEFRERMVENLKTTATAAQASSDPVDQSVGAADPNVISLATRRRRTWAPLAIAASLVLGIALVFQNQPVDLPGYGVSLQGYTQELRSGTDMDAGEVLIFADGNRFRLVLTPETTVERTIATRLILVTDGARRELNAPPADVSEDGAVLIQGTIGRDILLPSGDSTLLVAVGHATALPDAGTLEQRLVEETAVRETEWSGWRLALRMQ